MAHAITPKTFSNLRSLFVKALEWAKKNGLVTVALVGGKKGRMAEIADHVIVIPDTHYGRVEDAQMNICHMLCYAFMENPELAKG